MLWMKAFLLIFVIIDVVLLALLVAKPALTATAGGKIFAFLALFIFPALAITLSTYTHMERSKTTEFCLSCHVMQDYGKSLHVDDRGFIPAIHYQNNLVPRDNACYTCHTDYTIFGGMTSKLRGLKHVYVQYFSQPPAKIKLYTAYNNRECLHCHSGARSFEEGATHNADPATLPAVKANKKSCLECHDTIHNTDKLNTAAFWKETK